MKDYIKTILSALQHWVQSFIAPLEGRVAAMEKAGGDKAQLVLLIEADTLPAVHDSSGAILTDEKGNIVLRY